MPHKFLKTKILFLILACLIVAAFTSSAFGQPDSYKIISVANQKDVPNRSGGYLPLGKKPARFSNLYNITFEYVKIPANGADISVVGAVNLDKIRPDAPLIYQFEELALSDKTVSFKTETIDNVHYEFCGQYLKKGELVRFNRKKVSVLRGTLTKYANNKKAAESEMLFSYVVWEAPYYIPPKS